MILGSEPGDGKQIHNEVINMYIQVVHFCCQCLVKQCLKMYCSDQKDLKSNTTDPRNDMTEISMIVKMASQYIGYVGVYLNQI